MFAENKKFKIIVPDYLRNRKKFKEVKLQTENCKNFEKSKTKFKQKLNYNFRKKKLKYVYFFILCSNKYLFNKDKHSRDQSLKQDIF